MLAQCEFAKICLGNVLRLVEMGFVSDVYYKSTDDDKDNE